MKCGKTEKTKNDRMMYTKLRAEVKNKEKCVQKGKISNKKERL